MKTFDITNHFSELDRSILEGEGVYTEYFDHMKMALNALLSSIPDIRSDNPYELAILQDFSQKFLNTMEAFRMKYAFSEDQRMLIDVTESGFPNFLEFKKLQDDIQRRDEMMRKMKSVEELKNEVLDELILHRRQPNGVLKELSKAMYYRDLLEYKLFREFTPGKLQLLKVLNDADKTRRFLYSWASFDSVTNRPYIYLMIFDNPPTSKKEKPQEHLELFFVENIRKVTHNSAPLKVIASDIDNDWEDIKPRSLKRIELGPIFSRYARDDHQFTQLVQTHFGTDDMIVKYESEYIFSTGEKRTNSFLSKGELRQVFYVEEANKECLDRMVSKVFKYMITSHRVLQHLTAIHPEVLKELSVPPSVYKA